MPWPPTGWRAPSPSWWRPPGSSSRSSLPIQSSYRSWRDLRAFLWTMCLDHAGVLYLANCKARLGLPDARLNREPDFLVCHNGKWGMLEGDGEPFHPPSRTVQDHERDRLFKQHGIRAVEHFDATACYETPQAVVKKFLDILQQS